MAKFSNLIGRNQLMDNVISNAELDLTIQTQLQNIDTNTTNINSLKNKFANNGTGALLSDYVPHIAMGAYAGEATSEQDMLSKTVNLDGTPIEQNDRIDRTDENRTYFFLGGDRTQAANWKPVLTPGEGVTAVKNTTGNISTSGIVVLSDLAFSGSAADVSLNIANFDASNVQEGFIKLIQADTAINQSIQTLNTAIADKLGLSQIETYVELTGTIDGVNKRFESATTLTGKKVLAYIGGQLTNPSDYIVVGDAVEFTYEPNYEQQRPALVVFG